MKRGRKQRLNGDEHDAIVRWPLCVFDNITGLRKYIKTKLNRRERQEAKKEIRNEQE